MNISELTALKTEIEAGKPLFSIVTAEQKENLAEIRKELIKEFGDELKVKIMQNAQNYRASMNPGGQNIQFNFNMFVNRTTKIVDQLSSEDQQVINGLIAFFEDKIEILKSKKQ